jgi:hypothetical protein
LKYCLWLLSDVANQDSARVSFNLDVAEIAHLTLTRRRSRADEHGLPNENMIGRCIDSVFEQLDALIGNGSKLPDRKTVLAWYAKEQAKRQAATAGPDCHKPTEPLPSTVASLHLLKLGPVGGLRGLTGVGVLPHQNPAELAHLAEAGVPLVRDGMAYDHRSAIVHGSTPKEKAIKPKGEPVELHVFVAATEEILRAALHKALTQLTTTGRLSIQWDDRRGNASYHCITERTQRSCNVLQNHGLCAPWSDLIYSRQKDSIKYVELFFLIFISVNCGSGPFSLKSYAVLS